MPQADDMPLAIALDPLLRETWEPEPDRSKFWDQYLADRRARERAERDDHPSIRRA